MLGQNQLVVPRLLACIGAAASLMIVTATVAVYHHAVVALRTEIVSNLVIGLGLRHTFYLENPAIAFAWLSRIDL